MRKSTLSIAAVLTAIVGIIILIAWRYHQPHPLNIGDKLPEFEVPALSSGRLHLEDTRGKILVLNFWATWCPPCVEETPSLVRFAEKMRASQVDVVSVSEDQDAKALSEFVTQYHVTFPVGRDPDRSLAARFGTKLFPETYIFDRHGRLALKIADPANWDDPRLQEFVLELAGK